MQYRGGFPRPSEVPFASPALTWMPADLDLDGDADLAGHSPYALRSVWTALNDGTGALTGPASQDTLVADRGKSLLLADLDRDLDLDLIIDNYEGVFLGANDGSGRFAPGEALPLADFAGGPARNALRALLDLDADGGLDAVLAVGDRSHCLPDDGACSIRHGLLFLAQEDPRRFVPRGPVHAVKHRAEHIAAADLDLDGDLDVAAALSRAVIVDDESLGSEVGVYVNDGSGDFRAWGAFSVDVFPAQVIAADFDGDARPDIMSYGALDNTLSFARNRLVAPLQPDADADGSLDVCEGGRFRRADWNQDGGADLSDAVAVLDFLFRGGPAYPCFDALDADDSGRADISDPIYALRHLFLGGAPPPAPSGACGRDPTLDNLPCLAFAACE